MLAGGYEEEDHKHVFHMPLHYDVVVKVLGIVIAVILITG